MRHEVALFSKLTYIEVVMLATLAPSGVTFAQAFSIGMVCTAVLYVFGDLALLPATNNFVAAGIDGLLAYVLTWSSFLYTDSNPISINIALLVAALIVMAELLFHPYMRKYVLL